MLSSMFTAPVLALLRVSADVITGIPDAAPPGYGEWISEIVLPAKNVSGDGEWASATAKARAFVAKLTLEEKVNVTTGTADNRCIGNTGVRTCSLALYKGTDVSRIGDPSSRMEGSLP
jgi:hypothetical protein